jgi:hypothetical protein
MSSVIVVMANVLPHESPVMPLIQDDDVIEHVPAVVANPAFVNTVLPWASKAGSFDSGPSVLTM